MAQEPEEPDGEPQWKIESSVGEFDKADIAPAVLSSDLALSGKLFEAPIYRPRLI